MKKGDLEVFEAWLRSPTVPQALAVRAKILLASARGEGVRPLAKEVGVSFSTVQRIWRQPRLQPHRVGRCKFRTDSAVESTLADVVGLYLDPPERADATAVRIVRRVSVDDASVETSVATLPVRELLAS